MRIAVRRCLMKLLLGGAVWLLASACLAASPTPTQSAPTATPKPKVENVALTLGSWRPEDVKQMNHILAKFQESNPTISITYIPTTPAEYNAALEAQLAGGTAPDLFYLRSYAVSRKLFEQGYLASLDDLTGLRENFDLPMVAPWATDAGVPYGVPFIATSHGVYFNQDLFDKLKLTVPETWEQLLATARAVKAAGYIPFANASGEKWTIGEIVFMNLAPNFIGGREGRQAYLAGQRCFNDARMVAAFQAVQDLAPFLPANQAILTYQDSQQLFLQGRAAMWLGGSWDIPFFEDQQPAFAWSVFAVPPPAGQPGYVTFQLDAGVGLNAASQHKAEARKFLEWLTSPELAELLGNNLPGFFPMHKQKPALQDEHAKAFLALNVGRGTDVRFVWEKLTDGQPNGYDLVQAGAVAVIRGEMTPQAAADALQVGLALWYAPAQSCTP
jgi:raffinose/stachyose/melibiose transport system substrate-binding protein